MPQDIIDRLNVGINERIIPKETEKGIVSVHLKRYQFAANYCKDKIVLDAACGVGYGTLRLATMAKSIIGLDIDRNAIDYANKHYRKSNVDFIQMDISKEIRFANGYFDIVCSFETIEHLPDINKYMQEIIRVLKDNGIYFVSVPFIKKTNINPKSKYHHTEYNINDLKNLLAPYFNKIEFYGQRRKSNKIHRFLRRLDFMNIRQFNLNIFKKLSRLTGNIPFAELSLDDIEIVRDDFYDANSIIAVCRKK